MSEPQASGLRCAFDNKPFPHLGSSLVPGGPTKWFCNETCKRKWEKQQRASATKPTVKVEGP